MGMFDYVNYECICPVCHAKIDGFQSKSGNCELETLEPTEVTNFYTNCSKCGCWVDFKAKEVTNFTRTVESNKGKEREILYKHTKEVYIAPTGERDVTSP